MSSCLRLLGLGLVGMILVAAGLAVTLL